MNAHREDPVIRIDKKLSLILAILTLISIIASAAISAGLTTYKVEQNEKVIADLKEENKEFSEKLNAHETYIQVLNSKLDSISTDIKEIKQDVKDINRGR